MPNWIRFNPTADDATLEQGSQADEAETFADDGFSNVFTRQFDSELGGGFWEAPTGDRQTDDTESIAGFDVWGSEQENPFLVGPVRTAYDYTFEYDENLNEQGDTRDLPGGNVADTVRGTDEYLQGEHDAQNWITAAFGLVIAMGVLYLIRPLLEIGAAIAEGE